MFELSFAHVFIDVDVRVYGIGRLNWTIQSSGMRRNEGHKVCSCTDRISDGQ